MNTALWTILAKRRRFLRMALLTGLGLAGSTVGSRRSFSSADLTDTEDDAEIRAVTGRMPVIATVKLEMPAVFGNGYSVPLSLAVDSPMTADDHVQAVHVLAPRNPIVVVFNVRFTPQSGQAALSTRIRLAGPQNVIAVAEMNDGTLLMALTWVKVGINGCN